MFFSPLVIKLIAGAVVLAAIGGGIAYWSIHKYNQGYAQAIADIAARDKGAVDAVNKAKSKVDECVARNGTWDVTVGVCR